MPQLVFAGAIGAALAYFLDRENGRRRRKVAADKAGKYFRQAGRQAQGVGARAQGVKAKVARRREQEKPQPDDVTLARKVETEIFRDAEVPKGQINVNAEDGVVYLRGEVEQPEMIRDLEDRARTVQGVLGVENLLHAPGQPAPAKPE
jgi:osmotically-inducible protein OsmY